MKKMISGLLALVMATSIMNFGIIASAEDDTVVSELVLNGDFSSALGSIPSTTWKFNTEAANTTWEPTNANVSLATVTDRDGNENQAAKFAGSGAIGQRIAKANIMASTQYVVEAYVKGTGTITLTVGRGDKTYPKSNIHTTGSEQSIECTDDWQLITTEFTSYSQQYLIDPVIVFSTSNASDTIYLDDVSVKQKIVKIDYKNEKLIHFLSGSTYQINGSAASLTDDEQAIENSWFGTQLTITGGNPATQYLTIPAHPAAPDSFTVTQPAEEGGTGSISGITASMEYKIDDGSWTDGDGNDVTNIAGGSTVLVRTKATDTSFKSAEKTIQIIAYGETQEAAPQIEIDYINGKLKSFAESGDYTINGNDVTLDASNELEIDEAWYNTTLSIIKKGSESNNTIDSEEQILLIPKRPDAPSESDFTITKPESNDGTGSIAGVTSAMEYKIGDGDWSQTASLEAIPNGTTVQIRQKATTTSFAGEIFSVTLSASKTVFENGKLENGDTVIFDFGSAASDGTIKVDAEKDYFGAADTDSKLTYGFLGLGEDGYSKTTYRDDAFSMVKDQRIWLLNGGASDATGAAGDNVYAKQDIRSENYGEKDYAAGDSVVPIRFAVKADRHSYYKVKAIVGCGDTTQGTTVSVFSERRHPAVTELVIPAGETKTVEFTANVMDVYFKNDGKTYADDMLTFTIIGKNAGLASLEITRIDPTKAPAAIWVCSDSTGCDQYSYLPFYPLQNYAGVGQYLSKYLTDMTVSNQGEGGLASGDNAHFNSAVNQWKSGDYLYVEYGHNENSTTDYTANLEKYYTAAHKVGVNLIIAAPIDRCNPELNKVSYFDSATGTWSSTLAGYKNAGKAFVEDKITNGANDIAFVDLNTPWVDFMTSETKRIAEVLNTAGIDSTLTYSANAIHYYYTYNKLGAADKTHINDYGADNASYLFFEALKSVVTDGASAAENSVAKIQSDVLKPIYNDLRASVTPSKVSDDVIKDGYAPNSHYPAKFTARIEYPYSASIEEITQNEDGTLKSAKVRILQDLLAYAAVYVTAYDENNNVLGTFHSTVQGENTGHIDNTSDGAGVVKELVFDSDIVPHHFDATVYYCDKENVRLTEADLRAAVSPKYESRKVIQTLIDNDFSAEDSAFSTLADEASILNTNNWKALNSASLEVTKQTENGESYINFNAGANSRYLYKNLGQTINSGKLEITFKARYKSGSAAVRFAENTGVKVNNSTWGSWRPAGGGNLTFSGTAAKNGSVDIGEVNTDEWIDYRILIDLDNSTSEVYCGAYGTTEAPITLNDGENITQLLINSDSNSTGEFDLKDIKVYTVETYDFPTIKISAPTGMVISRPYMMGGSAATGEIFNLKSGAYKLGDYTADLNYQKSGNSWIGISSGTTSLYSSVNIALDEGAEAELKFGERNGSSGTNYKSAGFSYTMSFSAGDSEAVTTTDNIAAKSVITLKPQNWYNVTYVSDLVNNKITVAVTNITTGETVKSEELTFRDIKFDIISAQGTGDAYIAQSYIYDKTCGAITADADDVTVTGLPAKVGQTAEVTVTGKNDKVVKSVKIDDGEAVNAAEGTATVSVTGKEDAQIIAVEFVKPNVTLTYTGTAAGGTYSVTDIASGESVEEDTEITIVPVPEEGYEVDKVYAYATTDGSASEETEVSKTSDEYKTTVTEDTTVSVTFKKKKYEVTFVVDGNETKVEVDHGSTAQSQAPQNPTKEGDYLFAGWVKGNSSEGDVIDSWDVITANGTVYTAKFTEIAAGNVAVTFSAGVGGTLSGSASTEVTSGGNLTDNQIPVASKAGYTFLKWSDGTDEYTVEELKALTINEAKEFTATYTVNQYTVTYASADNGSFEVADIADGTKVDYNTEITIVPNPEEGYEVDKVYAYATADGGASEQTEVSKTEGVYKTTVTADTIIAVTFKEVQQPVRHTYIPLLSAFDGKIQIEKTNAASDTATLTVSLKNGVSAELPDLTAYIAVYSGGVLKEVRIEVFDSETGVINITKPTGLEGTDSYKIFIWTDKYEPVTEPITASLFEQ